MLSDKGHIYIAPFSKSQGPWQKMGVEGLQEQAIRENQGEAVSSGYDTTTVRGNSPYMRLLAHSKADPYDEPPRLSEELWLLGEEEEIF